MRKVDYMTVDQKADVEMNLEKYGMINAKPTITPMVAYKHEMKRRYKMMFLHVEKL